jgi:proteasome lid subunit RPN8/RPN11
MLILNENIKQQLQEDAFRTFPDECCGFFLK